MLHIMRGCNRSQGGPRHFFLISFCLQNRIVRGLENTSVVIFIINVNMPISEKVL